MHLFDLSLLAQRLKKHGPFKALAGAIEHAVDAHTARYDLSLAFDAAEEMVAIIKARGGDGLVRQPPVITLSLLTTAVILYVRATKTQSKNRKTFDLRASMNPSQQDFHRELVQLRDDAVAHYGHAAGYKGEQWNRQAAVMGIDPVQGQMATMVLSIRLAVDPVFVEKVYHHLDAIRGIYSKLVDEKTDLMQKAIVASLEQDGTLMQKISEHAFDALAFFKDERAVAAWMQSFGNARANGSSFGPISASVKTTLF